MRNLLMEQLTESELIVVNRCPANLNRAGFRRAVKVQNPMSQLIFEGVDGEIIPPSEDDLPYDVKGNKIVIPIDQNVEDIVDEEFWSIILEATDKTQKPFIDRCIRKYKRFYQRTPCGRTSWRQLVVHIRGD